MNRGRSKRFEGLWYLVKCMVFLSPWPWSNALKCRLLRLFGAKIGSGVVIKPRVNIHFPWRLVVGDHSWLGEEVFILNFEPVTIGAHCCISQRAFLCAGNHDFRDPAFAFRNRPIAVADGAWIAAGCFVGPGVSIGVDAVAMAGSVVLDDLPAGMLCAGNPCVQIKPRWKDAGPDGAG